MRIRTCLAVSLLVAWTGLPADAPRAADEADVALLESFLSDVQTMSARFEQSLVGADDSVVETSRGTLVIRRPDEFRWHYTEPYEQILVADGVNLWNYDVDLAQVTVKPQSEMLADTPATLLGGDRSVLDEFDVVDSETDTRGTVWLTLVPHDRENGFERMRLGFDDGVLQRMVFEDNLEQSTLIALLDLALNEPVDDSDFDFEPPADADLVGEPVSADGS